MGLVKGLDVQLTPLVLVGGLLTKDVSQGVAPQDGAPQLLVQAIGAGPPQDWIYKTFSSSPPSTRVLG